MLYSGTKPCLFKNWSLNMLHTPFNTNRVKLFTENSTMARLQDIQEFSKFKSCLRLSDMQSSMSALWFQYDCVIVTVISVTSRMSPVRLLGSSSIHGIWLSWNLVIGLCNSFRTLYFISQQLGNIRSKWSIPPFHKKSWGQQWLHIVIWLTDIDHQSRVEAC